MDTFDQNVDHITKWINQADALLDESEKKKGQYKEDILKVANKCCEKGFSICATVMSIIFS